VTTVYVDADACPVKDEVLKVAGRYEVAVVLVSNGGIRPSRDPLVTAVVVPEGPDAADKWIAERIVPGDICVTGDIPLAARVIEAGGAALNHNGEPFTPHNIGERLALRDLMADMRAAHPLAAGGSGKPFAKADRSRFLQALDRMLRAAARR
jgi:uncharacterized protein YaiI (UPF0178 family)